MQPRHVTFVIATYKRVEALRCTLRSLILQEHQDWTALVVGDCCGDETYEMVRSLGEPRIRYYNLPERIGEQSGPNSFGLSIATGDFIGFLNHDDLLLRDHLAYSLESMAVCGADFFIGEAANATRLLYEDNGAIVPVFTGIIPGQKDMRCLITPNQYIFDPSSFWLVRMHYAKAVGPWRPAAGLWRTPLRDWVMRAWRMGGTFAFGDRITGLRFWTQNFRGCAPLYSNITPEHDYMIERFMGESPDEIRLFVLQQIEGALKPNMSARKSRLCDKLRSSIEEYKEKVLADCFLWLGIDYVNLVNRCLGRPRGALLNKITRKRTGVDLPQVRDISALLKDPESYRLL